LTDVGTGVLADQGGFVSSVGDGGSGDRSRRSIKCCPSIRSAIRDDGLRIGDQLGQGEFRSHSPRAGDDAGRTGHPFSQASGPLRSDHQFCLDPTVCTRPRFSRSRWGHPALRDRPRQGQSSGDWNGLCARSVRWAAGERPMPSFRCWETSRRPHPEFRPAIRAGLRALGRLRDEAGLAALIKLLDNPFWARHAAEALGDFGDRRAVATVAGSVSALCQGPERR
jgi:hypothetical protein